MPQKGRPAVEHIGIDVHKKESQICILAEGGELLERRVRTDPRRFAEVLGERAPARILLDAETPPRFPRAPASRAAAAAR
jgi:hypothetical protein